MKTETLSEKRKALIENYYKNKIENVELLIDNVWDPHNLAAVMRSSDGLGIAKLALYYTHVQFPNMKKVGKKSSSSANKWILTERVTSLQKYVEEKKSQGYVFLAADLSPKTTQLTEFKFPEKCVIILGSEKQGISPEVRKITDQYISIPMVGMVKSYNISVAASIILYELFRQKGKYLKLRE